VVGPGEASEVECTVAEQVGRLLAQRGATLICGGLGGVMEAACRGATGAGGIAVGILPDSERSAANPYLTVAIATGLGEARNAIVARSADVLIAVGGEYGTLSEVALALKSGRRVIGLDTWEIEGVEPVSGPDEAVQAALGAG
jgi:uncharacterized protein (TIGR00725 family)